MALEVDFEVSFRRESVTADVAFIRTFSWTIHNMTTLSVDSTRNKSDAFCLKQKHLLDHLFFTR